MKPMDPRQQVIDRLKRCVARTLATTPSNAEVWGTAFLIDTKHALTCAHNLGPRGNQSAMVKLTFTAYPLQPERNGTPVPGTLDWDKDMVVLELDEAIDAEPVPMSRIRRMRRASTQGSKRCAASSAMGERGTKTRSST